MMNSYPNYEYQSPQQNQFQYNMGGYPSGYPPMMPPQQQNTGFVQGGTTMFQGGFNPVTGTISSPMVGNNNFNPYGSRFIGNPGYNPGTPIQNPAQGYAPFRPTGSIFGGVYSPFMSPYGYPYGQNQFDPMLQDILYDDTTSAVDSIALLEQIILTDKEREMINRNSNNYITGYDYYGRPIYYNGSYYAQEQNRQKQMEEYRKITQDHLVNLSKIAHAYNGEEFDEEYARKRFDPLANSNTNNQKILNLSNATPAEIAEYSKMQTVKATKDLEYQMMQYDKNEELLNREKEKAYAQIKASHDRLIGVTPGEHYDLKTFMDNGYKISINNTMKAAKAASRNGTNKYSQSGFRAQLSQSSNQPVPINSKDDEYVPVEAIIKQIYDKGRSDNIKLQQESIMKNNMGQISYLSTPALPLDASSHENFLRAVEVKKEKDDMRKTING